MGEKGAASGDLARFEKACRLYAELGLSPERTVTQLLRAGYDPTAVRRRFPTLPESCFAIPATLRSIGSPRAGHLPVALTDRAETGGAGANQTLAQTVLHEYLAHRAGTLIERSPSSPSAREGRGQSNAPSPSRAPRVLAASTDLSEGLSFQYVPLIQCSFPHADPGGITHFSRRNGWLELTLSTARSDTGLPYGVPARLLTIYCASEAVRSRSPEIALGASLHEFLRRLEVPITRGERGSLRVYANQLLRLIHCALSIDENVRDGTGRAGLHIRQTLFVEEARLWWDESQAAGQGSSLVLSPVLFESIVERSAPLSTRAIKQLRKSPMDLDVYAWLVHRLFHLTRPSTITWAQLSGQFGHGYALDRKFRRFFAESVQRVLHVYPEAQIRLGDSGVLLLPSRPHVPKDALVAAS